MRNSLKSNTLILAVTVLVANIGLGCVGSPQRTHAPASVIRIPADEQGTADAPKASYYIELARKQMRLAKVIASNQEWAKAESMLLRARADADVARMLLLENAAEVDRRAAEQRLRQLQQNAASSLEDDNQEIERCVP